MRQGIQAVDPADGVVVDESFPRWLCPAGTVVAFVLGAATVLTAAEQRGLVGVLVAIALVPWLVRLLSDAASWGWSLMTLVPLAVIQVGGVGWGWIATDTYVEQISFLLSLWLTVDDAVYRRVAGARATVGVVAVTIVGHGALVDWVAVPIWLAGLLLAYLGGRLLRNFALNVVRLREAEGQLAREAVTTEQRRIAHEVHDVVAHSLAVTALHLSAARMANDRGDPDATRAALLDAEALTRASLGDLRRTVRLLRPPADGSAIDVALPGLGELEAVVESYRAAGMSCDLTVAGDVTVVDDLTGLTALRVVQEALTNAVRHQVAAEATVVVTAGTDALTVEVRSVGALGPSGEPGVGLVGMRERVEARSGHLQVGPTDGGWLVTATLPGCAVGAEPSAGELAVASTATGALDAGPP